MTAFKKQAKGDRVLDFNNFIPYPKKYADLDNAHRKYFELVTKCNEEKNPERKRNLEALAKMIGKLLPTQDGFNSGGYDWCVSHWGTKWNACEPRVRETKSSLQYGFDTAWSPPTPVVLEMSRKFPDLEFLLKYWEHGAGYQGIFRVKNGNILQDATSDYHGSRGG